MDEKDTGLALALALNDITGQSHQSFPKLGRVIDVVDLGIERP